jgi:succinate dehydrogenase / fumarate reductase membrane anchor subunit
MTTQSYKPGLTRRALKPMPQAENSFERLAWVFMRYSGLILVLLVLSHFWMQHIIVGTHNITVFDTELRWGVNGKPVTIENVFWRVYYAVILMLAMLHGLNGFRQVAFDYLNQRGIYRSIMLLATAVVGIITVLGMIALFFGATIVTK